MEAVRTLLTNWPPPESSADLKAALSHCQGIVAAINQAWGVFHNSTKADSPGEASLSVVLLLCNVCGEESHMEFFCLN